MPKKPQKARRKKNEPTEVQIDGPFAQKMRELLENAKAEHFRKHCAYLIPMYVVDFLLLQMGDDRETTKAELQEPLEKLLHGFLDASQVEELMVISARLHDSVVQRGSDDSSPLFEKAGEEVYRLIPPDYLHPVKELLDHARKGRLVGNA